MLRSFRFFRGLRMLVKACQCCLPSLCWSMLLLAVFMCMGGLILGNLLRSFIQDEQQVVEDRKWVWEHYGTAYRATYTLYEPLSSLVLTSSRHGQATKIMFKYVNSIGIRPGSNAGSRHWPRSYGHGVQSQEWSMGARPPKQPKWPLSG